MIPCCAVFLVFVVHRRFFRAYRTARLLSYFGHSSSSARKLCLHLWVQLRQISLYVLRLVCGCRKNAHSAFAFLDNLGIVLTSFLLYFFRRSVRSSFLPPVRRRRLARIIARSYLERTVIQFSRYTGKISPIYRQREDPFVDPLLEKFFKVRKSPQFWQIQRRKFALYLFSHPSACRSHCLCEQIFL